MAMDYEHLSGKSFRVFIGDIYVKVEEFDISITDETKGVKTQGVPDGWVDGETGASGSITVDWKNLQLIKEAAKTAGSWKALPTFDIVSSAKTANLEAKIEAFGCKLKVSDLISIDPKGGEKTTHKLEFDVTGKDFIKIDGVPYLAADENE